MSLFLLCILGTWIGYGLMHIVVTTPARYRLVKHQVVNNTVRRDLGMPAKTITWRIQ